MEYLEVIYSDDESNDIICKAEPEEDEQTYETDGKGAPGKKEYVVIKKDICCFDNGDANNISDYFLNCTQEIDLIPQSETNLNYSCVKCKESFPSSTDLLLHMKIHEEGGYNCPLCNNSFKKKDYLKKHLRTHSKRPEARRHYCTLCGKSYTRLANLNQHIVSHTLKKHLACNYCNKILRSLPGLKTHISLHHGEQIQDIGNIASTEKKIEVEDPVFKRTFLCRVCAIPFKTKKGVCSHALKHFENKFFVCDVCSLTFSARCEMKKHLFVHKEVNPYACKKCENSYRKLSNLTMHFKTHDEKENKTLKCSFCSKIFGTQICLDQHLSKKSFIVQYECRTCSKTYNNKTQLEIHLNAHSGHYSFTRDTCSEIFMSAERLGEHIQIHVDPQHVDLQIVKEENPLQINIEDVLMPVTCELNIGEEIIQTESNVSVSCTDKDIPVIETDQTNLLSVGSSKSKLNKNPKRKSKRIKDIGEFECETCNKKFSQRKILNNHLIVHYTEKKHRCPTCGKSFKRKNSLKRHKLVHSTDREYRCLHCEKTFKRKFDLTKHEASLHGERNFVCEVCNKSYAHTYTLKVHFLTHITNKHICKICDAAFKQEHNLVKHIMDHVKNEVKEKNNKIHNEQIKYKREVSMDTNKKCPFCDDWYSCYSELHNHLVTHIRNPVVKKMHICGMCDKIFTSPKHLDTHVLVHVDIKPYKCAVCDNKFTRKSRLRNHLLTKHPDVDAAQNIILEDPEYCIKCDRSFDSVQKKILHTMKEHKGEFSNVCEICDKVFLNRHKLNSHMVIHSDDRPYMCDICSKSFKRIYSLNMHKQMHSTERQYKCHLCNADFKWASVLRDHLLIHDDKKSFLCEVCKKSFKRRNEYKRHVSLHTDRRDFKCDKCTSDFKTVEALRKHQFVHGEKQFECEFCKRLFKRTRDRAKHIQRSCPVRKASLEFG